MKKKGLVSKTVRMPRVKLVGSMLDRAIKNAQKDKQWVREVREFIRITS